MLNRREALALCAGAGLSQFAGAADQIPMRDGIPSVDYHVHVGDELSVGRAIQVSRQRGEKFGLLQHAGEKRGGYAVYDDDSLNAWIRSLEGKPVFKAIEAETTNWPSLFSKTAIAKLDYIQADALGLPDKSGAPMQIWKRDFQPANPQEFMDRYVDFILQRISEPIDIFVVPTFLPDSLLPDYDRLWTAPRARAIIDAALANKVALEIDCHFRVPHLRFLEMARDAGVMFAFGSNYQTPESAGDISYCIEVYKRLGLTPRQFFRPSGAGRRF